MVRKIFYLPLFGLINTTPAVSSTSAITLASRPRRSPASPSSPRQPGKLAWGSTMKPCAPIPDAHDLAPTTNWSQFSLRWRSRSPALLVPSLVSGPGTGSPAPSRFWPSSCRRPSSDLAGPVIDAEGPHQHSNRRTPPVQFHKTSLSRSGRLPVIYLGTKLEMRRPLTGNRTRVKLGHLISSRNFFLNIAHYTCYG